MCDGTGFAKEQDPPPVRGFPTLIGETLDPFFSTLSANLRRVADRDEYLGEDDLSPAEVKLAEALYRAGVHDYEQGHKVGPFYPDLWFPDCALVVEVDGDAYHKDRAKDADRTAYLLDNGVASVLRIRAISVFADAESCVRAIQAERERLAR
jgi:very-short-patch-repair endonuclease